MRSSGGVSCREWWLASSSESRFCLHKRYLHHVTLLCILWMRAMTRGVPRCPWPSPQTQQPLPTNRIYLHVAEHPWVSLDFGHGDARGGVTLEQLEEQVS